MNVDNEHPDDAQLGLRLSTMLTERADQVVSHPVAASTIARRSRDRRRRRRTVAAGSGILATSALAFAAVRATDAPTGVSTAAAPTADTVDGSPATQPATTQVERRLRLALDLPGASLISAMDASQAPATEPVQPAPLQHYSDSSGLKRLLVSASEWPGPIPPLGDGRDEREVTLTDGTPARIGTPLPGNAVVNFLRDGNLFSVQGVGLTEEEVLAVASTAILSPSGAGAELTTIPPGMTLRSPQTIPVLVPEPLGTIDYQLPGGGDVSIHVERKTSPQLSEELAAAQAGRMASGVTLHTVRGQPALLRTFEGMTDSTLTWVEPDGTLVWLLVRSTGGIRPDPLELARHLVPIDEAAFQALVDAHPMVTSG